MQKQIHFVLGGPGSGKGTFCANLVKKMPGRTIHFSAGQLLRDFVKVEEFSLSDPRKQADLRMLKQFMREGKIVPAEITVKLLVDSVNECTFERILIDGFPRNESNYLCWQKMVKGKKNIQTKETLYLNCRSV